MDDYAARLCAFVRMTHGPLTARRRADGGLVWAARDGTGGDLTCVIRPDELLQSGVDLARNLDQYCAKSLLDPETWWVMEGYVPLSSTQSSVELESGLGSFLPPSFEELVYGTDGDLRLHRSPVASLKDYFDKVHRFILLGEPGAGKSTTLRWFLGQTAVAFLRGESRVVPVYIPLNRQRAGDSPREFMEQTWARSANLETNFVRLLGTETFLLLLDGLNELPGKDAAAQTYAWQDELARWPATQVIATCRSQDYDIALDLPQLELSPLSSEQSRVLAGRHLHGDADAFLTEMNGSGFEALLANPFSLSATAWLYRQGKIDQKVENSGLLQKYVRLLIRRAYLSGGKGLARQGYSFLESIAWMMQTGSRIAILEEDLPMAEGEHQGDLLEVAVSAQILTRSWGVVRFSHHLLQELLAAQRICGLWAAGERQKLLSLVRTAHENLPSDRPELTYWQRLQPPPTTGWDGPLRLAASQVTDPNAFIESLLSVDALLAGRLAAHVSGPVAADEGLAAVTRGLVLVTEAPMESTPRRLAAGRLLGQLGDPRLQMAAPGPVAAIGRIDHQSVGKFPVVVSEFGRFVDAGGYSQAEWWSVEGRQWLKNGIAHHGVVEGMLSQRATLLDSEHSLLWWGQRFGWGPETADFWAEFTNADEGKATLLVSNRHKRDDPQAPAFWGTAEYMEPNTPVVGVTYFEAEAYCNWLSSSAGLEVEVQSIDEWLDASAGAIESPYPWGGDPIPDFANTIEAHVLQLSPVGVFPHDVGISGAMDVVGNVREWTRTDHILSRGAYRLDQKRVAGGAWSRSISIATRAHIDSFAPDFWDYNLGFRIAVRPV